MTRKILNSDQEIYLEKAVVRSEFSIDCLNNGSNIIEHLGNVVKCKIKTIKEAKEEKEKLIEEEFNKRFLIIN